MKLPFIEAATVVGDPKELCVAHEEVYALHPAAFLFLVDADAALPPVAFLVCASGASLVVGRPERVEFRGCDICTQGAVDGRENIFDRHKRVVRCVDFNRPGKVS